MKGQSLCYSDANSGWWATSPSIWNNCAQTDPPTFEKRRLRQIFAYNVSTVKERKSSIMMNKKSTTGFPTSYIWSAYVTSVSPKVPQKAIFGVKIKFNFIRAKFATKFLYMKTSSSKVVV